MKKITYERLKNIALYYLERYEACTSKLREVLKRRVKKTALEQPVPQEAFGWIEQVISEMERLGYINNQRFTENTIRRLSNSGKSKSYISTKLKLAGIEEEQIRETLSQTNDLENARIMVQKKHLGKDFQKDLARLARAGFSYETARKALEEFKEGANNV